MIATEGCTMGLNIVELLIKKQLDNMVTETPFDKDIDLIKKTKKGYVYYLRGTTCYIRKDNNRFEGISIRPHFLSFRTEVK